MELTNCCIDLQFRLLSNRGDRSQRARDNGWSPNRTGTPPVQRETNDATLLLVHNERFALARIGGSLRSPSIDRAARV
jgi:hypothetical protein